MEKSNDILIPEFERLLKDGHMVEFIPKGVSMRPCIEGGRDRVMLKMCREPKVGYIVLAKVGENFVLHRIYQINGRTIVLRGDGNLEGYEICKAQDIIARVVRIRKIGGKRKRLTKAPIWRHLPKWMKKFCLKIYRATILLTYTDYEN